MNNITTYEGRKVNQFKFQLGDWETLYINIQEYRDNKVYLSYKLSSISGTEVLVSKGMMNRNEVISVIKSDYNRLSADLNSFINFLKELDGYEYKDDGTSRN